ncbi:major facilitator superfamily MFS 1 [Burkholderia cepacia GG4]|uniref:Major facilitator superfamily MFS 1 n=1 Tax=Burkholderia cepacia GG4 TaxID=1009846 RepID=A0A9W3K5V7_BURCE|nr:major facilitator superfamily MFS 1 [Burkholderia cepacia GG4]
MRAVPQPEHAGQTQTRPDAGATEPDRMAAWRLAICLSLGSAIALGLARFSYALLLPPMKADLGWTFAQAGALNTANAAGYLLGAFPFPSLSRRARPCPRAPGSVTARSAGSSAYPTAHGAH